MASARPADSIIGLHGRKRSGKDTTGQFIQDWAHGLGLSHRKQGWADKMKLSIGRLFDCPDDMAILFCDNIKEWGTVRVRLEGPGIDDFGHVSTVTVDGREFLKRYGTESHRDIFGQDFWLDQLLPFHEWPKLWDHAAICIVSDCRFVNEINRIHDLGGQVWFIDRDTGDDDPHVSEQIHRDLCDHVIENNDSLVDLRDRVYELLSPSKED